jgi:hypothetical protein
MRVRITLATLVAGLTVGLAAPAAQAQLTIANNCTTPTSGGGTTLSPNQPCWVAGVYNDQYTNMQDTNYVGPPAQESGGHAFTGVTDFTVGNTAGDPDGTVKDIRVDVPPGLVSNPLATPKCNDAALTAGTCPANTQLGIVRLEAFLGVPLYAGASVYNMPVESSTCPGYVSDFAFYVAASKARVDICGSVNKRPPYNLYFTIVAPPPTSGATVSSTLIFWGVPGDTGHKPALGWSCLNTTPCTPPATSPGTPSGTPFLTNPTACLPSGQITTLTLTSTTGQTVQSQSKTPVPAIGCQSLRFSPKMTLKLTGKHQTSVGKHPTLIASISQTNGQANIGLSKLTLPLSLALDPNNSQHVCSQPAFNTDTCPSSTLIGHARATTPVLSQPLSGPVYLVQGVRCLNGEAVVQGTCPNSQEIRTLPWLLVELRGQAAIDLIGTSSVSHKRLVTTFSGLPDLPESSFTLTINGGKRGILVVTGHKSLCSGKQVASNLFVGHNGASKPAKIKMTTPCKAPKKH